jgi:hypothetical protein
VAIDGIKVPLDGLRYRGIEKTRKQLDCVVLRIEQNDLIDLADISNDHCDAAQFASFLSNVGNHNLRKKSFELLQFISTDPKYKHSFVASDAGESYIYSF